MTLLKRLVSRTHFTDLDAFPKVPEDFKKQTLTGGTFSIISYILIIVLVTNEFYEYLAERVIFRYRVDDDLNSRLDINVDITIASPCESIGADVIDPTNQNNAYTYGRLIEDDTWFDLTPGQAAYWESVKDLNQYLREEHHRLRDILWRPKTRQMSADAFFGSRGLPPPEILRSHPPDACRLHGILSVNKVAGNLHVTSGKHIPLPIGHAHISISNILEGGPKPVNFSHRIERLSFGPYIPSIINPLEGEEKGDLTAKNLFQYYIKVVSTHVNSNGQNMKSYQYSVTETSREIDHIKDSHGTPGIHFRYDIDAIAVHISDQYIPLSYFLIRLCGVVGGVYATSGFFSRLTSIVVDLITCKYLERIRTANIQDF